MHPLLGSSLVHSLVDAFTSATATEIGAVPTVPNVLDITPNGDSVVPAVGVGLTVETLITVEPGFL